MRLNFSGVSLKSCWPGLMTRIFMNAMIFSRHFLRQHPISLSFFCPIHLRYQRKRPDAELTCTCVDTLMAGMSVCQEGFRWLSIRAVVAAVCQETGNVAPCRVTPA